MVDMYGRAFDQRAVSWRRCLSSWWLDAHGDRRPICCGRSESSDICCFKSVGLKYLDFSIWRQCKSDTDADAFHCEASRLLGKRIILSVMVRQGIKLAYTGNVANATASPARRNCDRL